MVHKVDVTEKVTCKLLDSTSFWLGIETGFGFPHDVPSEKPFWGIAQWHT